MALERYWCNAELIGSIYDGNGQPLWQGRSVRTTTDARGDWSFAGELKSGDEVTFTLEGEGRPPIQTRLNCCLMVAAW